MFKCLQESLAQPDFGQACRAQVEERGQRMQEDYRLDYGVAEACEPDVTTYCAAEKVRLGQSQGAACPQKTLHLDRLDQSWYRFVLVHLQFPTIGMLTYLWPKSLIPAMA